MSSTREQLELYVDSSLGQAAVPGALRALGFIVHTEVSIFGRVREGIPDPVWLERAGRDDWVVFTKDARIRYRTAEREALARAGVRAFVLAGGNLRASDQIDRFVRNINRIRNACRSPGPFIYAVYSDGIEKIYP